MLPLKVLGTNLCISPSFWQPQMFLATQMKMHHSNHDSITTWWPSHHHHHLCVFCLNLLFRSQNRLGSISELGQMLIYQKQRLQCIFWKGHNSVSNKCILHLTLHKHSSQDKYGELYTKEVSKTSAITATQRAASSIELSPQQGCCSWSSAVQQASDLGATVAVPL